MHNLIRAFIITLTLTGATATITSTTKTQVTNPRPTSMPRPVCPPNDPNGCGIKQN